MRGACRRCESPQRTQRDASGRTKPAWSTLEQVTFSLRGRLTASHLASTSTNAHTGCRTTPHEPHRFTPSRTTNRTTRCRRSHRRSRTALGFVGSVPCAHPTGHRAAGLLVWPAAPLAEQPCCANVRTCLLCVHTALKFPRGPPATLPRRRSHSLAQEWPHPDLPIARLRPLSGELERDVEAGGRDDPEDAECFSPPAGLCHIVQVVADSYCGRPVVR
jgi:hypothetical protein